MENKKSTIEALMEQGKANGKLTTKEITDALEDKNLIPRPALHSFILELTHPVTGERLHLTAPLPTDMINLIPCCHLSFISGTNDKLQSSLKQLPVNDSLSAKHE